MQEDRAGMQKDSYAHAHPLPTPPPQAGEGADRVRRSLNFTPHEQWHRLHLHHHPPAREERRERVCRLNGFHFTGITSSAAWRGEIASGAKSSTATAAATAAAAARSSFA